MTRFLLPLAAGLALCAGIASADPSDRTVGITNNHVMYGQTRQSAGWAKTGGTAFGHARAQGSRASVVQSGRNNSATVRQRGNNKRAAVIQRGNDTDVVVDQHGEGPGSALVITW